MYYCAQMQILLQRGAMRLRPAGEGPQYGRGQPGEVGGGGQHPRVPRVSRHHGQGQDLSVSEWSQRLWALLRQSFPSLLSPVQGTLQVTCHHVLRCFVQSRSLYAWHSGSSHQSHHQTFTLNKLFRNIKVRNLGLEQLATLQDTQLNRTTEKSLKEAKSEWIKGINYFFNVPNVVNRLNIN